MRVVEPAGFEDIPNLKYEFPSPISSPKTTVVHREIYGCEDSNSSPSKATDIDYHEESTRTDSSLDTASNPINTIGASTRAGQRSTLPRSAFDPGNPGIGYENVKNFLKQNGSGPCDHTGPCKLGECSCADDLTTCRGSCGCSPNCDRRFPPCDHAGPCTSSCDCVCFGRECTEQCACVNCLNDFSDVSIPKTEIKRSTRPGAGLGLFACERISEYMFIGIYHGPNMEHAGQSKVKYVEDAMSSVQVSKSEHIYGKDWCVAYFINHSVDPKIVNAEFRYIERSGGREPLLFATRDIEAGEEILAPYRDHERSHFPLERDDVFFTHGDQVYYVGAQCFVHSKDPSVIRFPWVAEISGKPPDSNELMLRWFYYPHMSETAQEIYRGPYELLRTNHFDKITIDMLAGRAFVQKLGSECRTSMGWCWRDSLDTTKRAKPRTRKKISTRKGRSTRKEKSTGKKKPTR